MIEKLKEKLLLGNSKHSKGAKNCASIIWETECENAPKLSAKYFEENICKIKKNAKYFSNPNV